MNFLVCVRKKVVVGLLKLKSLVVFFFFCVCQVQYFGFLVLKICKIWYKKEEEQTEVE